MRPRAKATITTEVPAPVDQAFDLLLPSNRHP
jgi:hypothetical protein